MMPHFSHPRLIILETLAHSQATKLQNLIRALGLGDNYTPAEYLRVHQLMTRLLRDGFALRVANPRHGLTTYSITPAGLAALNTLNKKWQDRQPQIIPARKLYSQEMNIDLVRKKKGSSEISDEAPIVVRPVVPSAPPSLDVVRCPQCNFLIPAKEVRHSLYQAGTATCPKCQYDLSEAVGGNPVD